MRRFWRSFVYAGRGVWFCLRRERNFRIHLVTAAYVLGFAPAFDLTRSQWAVLCLTIALVLAAEAVNTAVEQVIDRVSPERHPAAGAAKDAAAGAVLLCAAGAVGVAVALFWQPAVWMGLAAGWREQPWRLALLALSIAAALWFIVCGGVRKPPPTSRS